MIDPLPTGNGSLTVFDTPRLRIRRVTTNDSDIEHLYNLWNNPQVMRWVGFPDGLGIDRDAIRRRIEKETPEEFDALLLVETHDRVQPIGECKLGKPDENGIAHTDVKLLPDYWGNRYGTEIKQGLVDYLFSHTDCQAIKATPNQSNIASQKMQKAVGGIQVGKGVFRLSRSLDMPTVDVPYYEFRVYRETWRRSR